MRRGFGVQLVEVRPGSLGDLGTWLEGEGYRLERALGEPPADQSCLRLVHVTGDLPAAALASLARSRPSSDVATAAVVEETDIASLSKALAAGVDDVLTHPFEESELRSRLDGLNQLGRTRVALAERTRTLARFMPDATAAQARRRNLDDTRPRVLVVGPASQHKVRIGEALGHTALNFAENLEQARSSLDTCTFDLVVLLATNAAARRDLERWPEMAGAAPPLALLATAGDEPFGHRDRLAVLPIADRLALPQPAEIIRVRLDFWLGLARLRRRLSGPLPLEIEPFCRDALTAVYNHGFFLEHLAGLAVTASAGRGLVALDLVNLHRINEDAGHAAANRLLARIGPLLASQLRAQDVVAYLGGGRFVVLLDDLAIGSAMHVGQRLERAVAAALQNEPPTPRLTSRTTEADAGMSLLTCLRDLLSWDSTVRTAA